MIARRWVLPEPSGLCLGEWPGLHPIIAQILQRRGCRDLAAARAFLLADADLTHDPWLLPDVDRAVARIRQAIRRGERIVVYGDYDADGLCATALLVEALSALGADVLAYIPDRFNEGYGLNQPALTKLAAAGVGLVVTVDAGITATAEIEHARALGVDVIVTDHHTVGPVLPNAAAAINPHRVDSSYPFDDLAGVGVAFKLAQALFRAEHCHFPEVDLLDLVAVGTVADVAPLVGENRYFVRHGLDVLRAGRRPGLAALCRRAGLDLAAIESRHLSHVIGPRLNAAGRIGSARVSYELLSTRDPATALQLADEIEHLNQARQQLSAKALQLIGDQLGPLTDLPPLLMFWDAAFHRGIAGPVAGRLAEEYGRPAVVIAIEGDLCHGSARSPEGFDVHQALTQCADLLLRFGGHRAAAGLTLAVTNLVPLQERLTAIVRVRCGEVLTPTLSIDAEMTLGQIDDGFWRQLCQLAPFGSGNPRPRLLFRGVAVLEARPLGDGRHVKLRISDDEAVRTAVAWNRPDLGEVAGRLDLVGEIEEHVWQGERELRVRVIDARPSG